jgi:hypothetical protein
MAGELARVNVQWSIVHTRREKSFPRRLAAQASRPRSPEPAWIVAANSARERTPTLEKIACPLSRPRVRHDPQRIAEAAVVRSDEHIGGTRQLCEHHLAEGRGRYAAAVDEVNGHRRGGPVGRKGESLQLARPRREDLLHAEGAGRDSEYHPGHARSGVEQRRGVCDHLLQPRSRLWRQVIGGLDKRDPVSHPSSLSEDPCRGCPLRITRYLSVLDPRGRSG